MAHIEYAVQPLRRSRDAIPEEATQATMSYEEAENIVQNLSRQDR